MNYSRYEIPKSAIGRWYQGKKVLAANQPKNTTARIMTYERHWTAKVARVLVTFYLKNWQFVIGTAIGVAGLWLAVLALR